MNYALVTLLALCMNLSPAHAEVSAYVEGQSKLPADISELVDRIVDCNHWLGEPPYDSARREEIDSAISSLQCNTIEQDKAAVLLKFQADSDVERAIQEAEKTVW